MPVTVKKKPVVVVGLPKDVPNLILKGRVYVLNVTNNPLVFSSLDPANTVVGGYINVLETAETALENRTGPIGPRNTALDAVTEALGNWGSQVQVLVRNLTSYSDQVNLIHLFGARVKVRGVFVKAPLTLTNPSPGVIHIVKARIADAVNEYQVSYDLGVTWDTEAVAANKLNKLDVDGFIKNATIFVRCRANIGLVKGVWIIEAIIITK
jgi:hypothetical protein